MDVIEIRGLRVFGHHGVLAHEQRDGQTFVIDLDLEVDLSAAATSDDLSDTVHYGEAAERVAAAVQRTRFDLIERLAGHLLDVTLAGDQRIGAATVRIAKPQAPIDLDFDHVAVRLRRVRTTDPS